MRTLKSFIKTRSRSKGNREEIAREEISDKIHDLEAILEPIDAKIDKKMSIALVDDDPLTLKLLKASFENIGLLVDCFSSGTEFLGKTNRHAYDLVILDIYMPGVTGMSIATELRSRGVKSPIIFLTSSTDHALEAFGVDATHYLLKPYTKDNFYVAMDKAMQSIISHKDDSIVLKVDNEYRSIQVSQIVYCEAEDKYQRFYLDKDEKLLIRISGTELYKQLFEFECFYRCGRAHIINLNFISKVTPNGVEFKNDIKISLPRAAVSGLRTAFFDYFN